MSASPKKRKPRLTPEQRLFVASVGGLMGQRGIVARGGMSRYRIKVEKAVLLLHVRVAGFQGRVVNGTTLAKEAYVDERTARRALNGLRERGLIDGKGKGNETRYDNPPGFAESFQIYPEFFELVVDQIARGELVKDLVIALDDEEMKARILKAVASVKNVRIPFDMNLSLGHMSHRATVSEDRRLFPRCKHQEGRSMPNVSAFQKADRLALLGGMHDFFDALSELPIAWDTTRVALLIRRCEYEGNPADVKTLEALLGWSKTKVLVQLKELEEYGFEFKAVKDENDHRRSVQRLYGRETQATTLFFQRCSDLVDKMVEAREAAKALRTEADIQCLPRQVKPKARFGWKRIVGSAAAAVAGGLAGFRYRQDRRPWAARNHADGSDRNHQPSSFSTIPTSVRATPQYGLRWRTIST